MYKQEKTRGVSGEMQDTADQAPRAMPSRKEVRPGLHILAT